MIRIPPNNKDIEAAVLGACMLSKETLYFAMQRLFEDLFYQNKNKAVYKAINALYGQNGNVDILTVYNQLKKSEDLQEIEGPYYLTTLQNNVVSDTQIETHINILCELFLKRTLIHISASTGAMSYDADKDAFELYNTAQNQLEQAQEKVITGKHKDIGYYVKEMLSQHAAVKASGFLGLQTNLHALDESISGLVAPDLIIIAARPGQGKTALALTIIQNLSIKGNVPVAFFSLEMDGVQIVRRLISMHTGIDHSRLRDGKTTEAEAVPIHETAVLIAGSPIFIEDKPTANIRDIRTRAHILHRKHKLGYIVVDYLQLMEGVETKNKTREQVVSEISRGLKVLAKELSIPVIALSQLNRSVESRGDKIPGLGDLRESGAIEQDADSVLLLMRPEYYQVTEPTDVAGVDYDSKGLCVVNIAKNRHGETKHIPLFFDAPRMHFKDIGSFTQLKPVNF